MNLQVSIIGGDRNIMVAVKHVDHPGGKAVVEFDSRVMTPIDLRGYGQGKGRGQRRYFNIRPGQYTVTVTVGEDVHTEENVTVTKFRGKIGQITSH